jgi:hypothetical protein
MRARMVKVAVAGALVLCACAAPSAQADFGTSWEALTCEVDATPVDPCTSGLRLLHPGRGAP